MEALCLPYYPDITAVSEHCHVCLCIVSQMCRVGMNRDDRDDRDYRDDLDDLDDPLSSIRHKSSISQESVRDRSGISQGSVRDQSGISQGSVRG